jgi:choline dehydrogenase-like flavoprotein
VPSSIHPKIGLYQDATHTLDHPLLESNTSKLEVLTGHEVIRVVFNSQKRASGIEVQSRQPNGKRFIINARKLVVLSAGALG